MTSVPAAVTATPHRARCAGIGTGGKPGRRRDDTVALLIAMCITVMPVAGIVHAADDRPATRTAAPTDACVEVEVNGQRALSLDCLNQRLADATAARPAPALPSAADRTDTPENQLGLFNRAATSNRMGNRFGRSVTPQRPLPQTQPPSPAPAPLAR